MEIANSLMIPVLRSSARVLGCIRDPAVSKRKYFCKDTPPENLLFRT